MIKHSIRKFDPLFMIENFLGVPGTNGPVGFTGQPGLPGAQGQAGAKGNRGAPGQAGSAGAPGSKPFIYYVQKIFTKTRF